MNPSLATKPKQEQTQLAIHTTALHPTSFGLLTPEKDDVEYSFKSKNVKSGLPSPSESRKPRKSNPIKAVSKTSTDPGFIIQLGFGYTDIQYRKVNYEKLPHFQFKREDVQVEKKRKRGSRRSSINSIATL